MAGPRDHFPADSAERRSGRISSIVLMVIGAAACVACVVLAVQSTAPPANYDIAELLKKNPQDYALSFGHFLDLTPRPWAPSNPIAGHGNCFCRGNDSQLAAAPL